MQNYIEMLDEAYGYLEFKGGSYEKNGESDCNA